MQTGLKLDMSVNAGGANAVSKTLRQSLGRRATITTQQWNEGLRDYTALSENDAFLYEASHNKSVKTPDKFHEEDLHKTPYYQQSVRNDGSLRMNFSLDKTTSSLLSVTSTTSDKTLHRLNLHVPQVLLNAMLNKMNHIHDVFLKADKKGTGHLTKEQFFNVIKSIGLSKQLSYLEINNLANSLDHLSNNKLSYEDLFRIVRRIIRMNKDTASTVDTNASLNTSGISVSSVEAVHKRNEAAAYNRRLKNKQLEVKRNELYYKTLNNREQLVDESMLIDTENTPFLNNIMAKSKRKISSNANNSNVELDDKMLFGVNKSVNSIHADDHLSNILYPILLPKQKLNPSELKSYYQIIAAENKALVKLVHMYHSQLEASHQCRKTAIQVAKQDVEVALLEAEAERERMRLRIETLESQLVVSDSDRNEMLALLSEYRTRYQQVLNHSNPDGYHHMNFLNDEVKQTLQTATQERDGLFETVLQLKNQINRANSEVEMKLKIEKAILLNDRKVVPVHQAIIDELKLIIKQNELLYIQANQLIGFLRQIILSLTMNWSSNIETTVNSHLSRETVLMRLLSKQSLDESEIKVVDVLLNEHKLSNANNLKWMIDVLNCLNLKTLDKKLERETDRRNDTISIIRAAAYKKVYHAIKLNESLSVISLGATSASRVIDVVDNINVGVMKAADAVSQYIQVDPLISASILPSSKAKGAKSSKADSKTSPRGNNVGLKMDDDYWQHKLGLLQQDISLQDVTNFQPSPPSVEPPDSIRSFSEDEEATSGDPRHGAEARDQRRGSNFPPATHHPNQVEAPMLVKTPSQVLRDIRRPSHPPHSTTSSTEEYPPPPPPEDGHLTTIDPPSYPPSEASPDPRMLPPSYPPSEASPTPRATPLVLEELASPLQHRRKTPSYPLPEDSPPRSSSRVATIVRQLSNDNSDVHRQSGQEQQQQQQSAARLSPTIARLSQAIASQLTGDSKQPAPDSPGSSATSNVAQVSKQIASQLQFRPPPPEEETTKAPLRSIQEDQPKDSDFFANRTPLEVDHDDLVASVTRLSPAHNVPRPPSYSLPDASTAPSLPIKRKPSLPHPLAPKGKPPPLAERDGVRRRMLTPRPPQSPYPKAPTNNVLPPTKQPLPPMRDEPLPPMR